MYEMTMRKKESLGQNVFKDNTSFGENALFYKGNHLFLEENTLFYQRNFYTFANTFFMPTLPSEARMKRKVGSPFIRV